MPTGVIASLVERRLVRPPYETVEVALTYEVFNLILQIIALLGVVPIVIVEAIVAPAIMPRIPHWIGGFQEPFLLDLEEDFSSGRIERGVGEPGDGLLGSLHSFPRGCRGWPPGRFGPRALLIFALLCH
ncbi:hypothetical protein BHM03_00049094 [Ensete ventricosum]|nr:hypothetical protein BHM03_00049094 [Ensete ventricosum]